MKTAEQLAREAGAYVDGHGDYVFQADGRLERLIALVRAEAFEEAAQHCPCGEVACSIRALSAAKGDV